MKKIFLSIIVFALTLLALTACGDRTGDRDGVRTAKYDSETGEVSVTATLTADTLKKYKGETLYLMEIPAGQSISDVATSVPAAQLKAKGTMEHTLDMRKGAGSLLYSGFVLAYYDYARGYVPMGEVRYLDNPQALAQSGAEYPTYSSIKGLFLTSAAEAARTGTQHTVIRVPVEDYIRAKGDEGTLATIFCGNSYYIDRGELARLDHKVKSASEAGVEVLLQFTLDTNPYELESGVGKLASLYTSGGSVPEGEHEHYALAVTDPDSFEKLASFFEFIAQRYTSEDGEHGFAGAFIVGEGVNDLERSNVDDQRTLAELTERYAELFRIAYTALVSKYANGKVFLSVNGNWTEETAAQSAAGDGDAADESTVDESAGEGTAENMPVARRRRFGAREFLANFAAKITLGGDIPYGICMTLETDEDSDVTNDVSEGGRVPNRITCGNLTALNTFLNGTGLTYNDRRRELAIIASIPALDEEEMAVSYAKLYFACLENAVCAFIYNGERDGETGNGETGLMTTLARGQKPEKRKIYDVYRTIDRAEGADVLAELSEELKNRAEELSEKENAPIYLTAKGTSSEPEVKRGETEALFTFDGTGAAGFYPAYSALSTERSGEGERSGIRTVLAPLGPGDLMGVRSPEIDGGRFDRVKVIRLTLNADLPGSNTGKLTLLLQSKGEKDVTYESEVTIQLGNDQTVYFDVSDFARETAEGEKVRLSLWCEADNNAPLRGEEAQDTGYCLTVFSLETVKQKPISPFVWVIPLILVLLAGGYFLYRYGLPPLAAALSNYRENTARERAARDGRARGQGQTRGQTRGQGGGSAQRPMPPRRPTADTPRYGGGSTVPPRRPAPPVGNAPEKRRDVPGQNRPPKGF